MGISTRRSARVAQKVADATNAAASSSGAASASTAAPAGPVGGVKKAVSKAVSKAKAKTKDAVKKAIAKGTQKKSPRRPQNRVARRSMPRQNQTSLQMFPTADLRNDAGETVSTADVAAESAFVVFLYPRANTPGCTTQACGFRDHAAELAKNGYRAFGLSYDSPKSQSSWKAKHSLPYPLWCDTPENGLIKALGAHKDPKSVKRSHFIVAKGGKILFAQIQISPKDSISHAIQFARNNPATAEQNGKSEEVAEGAMDVDPPAKDGAKDGAKDVATDSKVAADKDGDAAMDAEDEDGVDVIKPAEGVVEKDEAMEAENAAPEVSKPTEDKILKEGPEGEATMKEAPKEEVSTAKAPEKIEADAQKAAVGEAKEDAPAKHEAAEGEAAPKAEAQKEEVARTEVPASEKAPVETGKEISDTAPMDISKDAPKDASVEAPKEEPSGAPKEL